MRRIAPCAAAAGLIALAGCGGGGGKVKQTLVASETEPSANHYAFEGVKSLRPGAVKVTFTNSGKKDQHEFQLVRVDGNQTAAELTATFVKLTGGGNVPIPSWLHAAGGVGTLNPGATATATVLLKPGKYYAVDTDSGQANNAPPFITQGAIAAFEVKGSSAGGSLPSTSTNVTVKDVAKNKFRFDNSTLKKGAVTLTFDNTSKEFHHVQAFPLLPGKTPADVKKALAAGPGGGGPPPLDFQNGTGTAVVDPKKKLVAELNFTKSGSYVLLCFLQDRDGKGKRHFQEGLLKEVKVS
jgi:hypothetical protein